MIQPPTIQIAFVTDEALLRPTLLAMWSLLRHVTEPVQLHVWGDRLGDGAWQAVEHVAASDPRAELRPFRLDANKLAGAGSPASHISGAAMGRLFLPRQLTGRVLYLDGDTVVTGDVAPLFSVDLGGHDLGAVRDFVTADWLSRRKSLKPHQAERLSRLASYTDPASYFNSGVLLLDCDAIRAKPDLLLRLEDIEAASAAEWGDQDYLNEIFSGRVRLLNPAFNSSWGRTGRQRRFARMLGGTGDELAARDDVVLHFHGPKKPWKQARHDLWSPRARAVARYRRIMRQFVRAFPRLAF